MRHGSLRVSERLDCGQVVAPEALPCPAPVHPSKVGKLFRNHMYILFCREFAFRWHLLASTVSTSPVASFGVRTASAAESGGRKQLTCKRRPGFPFVNQSQLLHRTTCTSNMAFGGKYQGEAVNLQHIKGIFIPMTSQQALSVPHVQLTNEKMEPTSSFGLLEPQSSDTARKASESQEVSRNSRYDLIHMQSVETHQVAQVA